MTLSEYADYRESDVPWVSRVPASWRTVPFFTVMREQKRPNLGMVESNLLSLSFGRIIRKDISALGGLLPESFETYQIVEPGDIIFRFTDLQNDKRSLRTAMSSERGIITSAYGTATPTRIDPRYANYLMRAYDTSKVFYGLGGGVRQSIKLSDVARMPVLLPSPPEQRTIADFLDREIGKVNALVAEQEGLVQVLRERRTALISRVVTKGLDRSVNVVPSGSDWLGDVPRHWTVVPLRRLGRSAAGSGFPVSRQGRSDLDYPFFKVKNLGLADRRGYLWEAEDTVDAVTADSLGARIFPAGTLVYAKVGAALMLGRVRTLGVSGCLDNNMAGFTPRRGVDSRWLAYAMSLVKFDYLVNPGAVPSLSDKNLASFDLAVPPVDEQRQIAAHLDEETERVDALIAEAEGIVSVANERRSALVSAAATGQIDVRGEVA